MVYVDPLRRIVSKNAQARRVGSKHGHLWSHLWADTLEELHAMATSIGMRRSWFQNDPRLPHYDLVPPRREEAIKRGARPVGLVELVAAMRPRITLNTKIPKR